MRRDEVIAVLRRHADAIRARGARSLYLFGSTARDQVGPASDIDVFVDPDYTRFTLLDWVDLEAFLTDVVGRPVDLTTRNALRPEYRPDIEHSATKVL